MIQILKNKHLPFLFAVPLFFFSYHYNGIVMDAILYITQYAFYVDPTRFIHDPAYEFGNQGSMGFFNPIFGLFIQSFGVSKGALIYTFAMQLGWVMAAVFLVKSMLKLMGQRLWTLPLIIVFVVIFANGMPIARVSFFHFVESYVCSRSLSIIFGMVSLAAIFSNRRWWSLLLLLMGTIVHPLTAGWCLPLWFFYFYPKSRIPILMFSLMFPFTFLLHWERLDMYPMDWPGRPLGYLPRFENVCKSIALWTFFFFAVPRVFRQFKIQSLAKSLCLIIFICEYWNFWGGYGEHILLYQSQPWRGIWLPSLIAVILFLCLVKEFLKRFRKTHRADSHDFALLLLGTILIAPQGSLLFVAIGLTLLKRKPFDLNLKHIMVAYFGLAVANLLVQQYHNWSLQGFYAFLGYHFEFEMRLIHTLLFYQLLLSIVLFFAFIKQRNFILAFLVVLFCMFPKFLLLPLSVVTIFVFAERNVAKSWLVSGIVFVVVIIDGLFGSNLRVSKILGGFSSNSDWLILFAVVSFVIIRFSEKKKSLPLVVWVLGSFTLALIRYDGRVENVRNAEAQVDSYLSSSIFPQVTDRGRLFISLTGRFQMDPSLRFLTGAYFSGSNHVPECLNEKHFKEVQRRANMLYYKENRGIVETPVGFQGFLSQKMSIRDSLSDRLFFLCEKREITHAVVEIPDLQLHLMDSADIGSSQRAYLYGCE